MSLGLIADVGMAILGNSANNKAAKVAATTAQNNNALAYSTNQDNNALLRDIYNSNAGTLSPFVQRGNQAGEGINALLGYGPSNFTGSAPQAGGTSGAGAALPAQQQANFASYVQNNPDLLAAFNAQTGIARGRSMDEFGRLHWMQNGEAESQQGRDYTPYGSQQALAAQQQATQAQAPQPQAGGSQTFDPAAQANAFQKYADSTGYQFQLKSGMDSILGSAAAKGLVNSGGTLKALQARGQSIGSTYFGNYLNALQNQQSIGANSAGALAGVGNTYGSGVVSGNNNLLNATTANNGMAADSKINAITGNANNWLGVADNASKNIGRALGSSYGG